MYTCDATLTNISPHLCGEPMSLVDYMYRTREAFEEKEPWLSAIASRVSRQQQKMTKMKTGWAVKLPTKESSEALLTLVQNSVTVEPHWLVPLEVTGNLEVNGWAALAKALSLAPPGWVHNVEAPVDSMREGRRADLRTVWQSLVADGVWFMEDGIFSKLDGEKGWGNLEQLLDAN